MRKRKSAVFLVAFVLLYFLSGPGAAVASSKNDDCRASAFVSKLVMAPVMVVKETAVLQYRLEQEGPRAVLRFGVRGVRHLVGLVRDLHSWNRHAPRLGD